MLINMWAPTKCYKNIVFGKNMYHFALHVRGIKIPFDTKISTKYSMTLTVKHTTEYLRNQMCKISVSHFHLPLWVVMSLQKIFTLHLVSPRIFYGKGCIGSWLHSNAHVRYSSRNQIHFCSNSLGGRQESRQINYIQD